MTLLSIIIGLCYIFTMTIGGSLYPEKKYYNKLFDFKTYLIHFIISLVVSGYGLYYILSIDGRGAFFFAPTIFLILFLLFDKLTLLLLNRHLLIVTKWDFMPPSYKWYVDGIVMFLLMFIPIISSGIIMNKINWGTFF